MAHYRSFFDNESLGVWDLKNGHATATIAKVQGGKVGRGQQASKKVLIHFEEVDKRFVVNVTNAQTIAGLYGSDVREWVGKRITLYATTTTFGKDTVECIRVRPTVPKGKGQPVEPQPVDPEVRARQEEAAAEADGFSADTEEDTDAT